MNNLTLIFPNAEMEAKALDYKKEFFVNGEKIINGSNRLDMDKYNYSEWLQIIDKLNKNTENLESDFLHTFFVARDNDKMVGIVTIRHPLTGFFKDTGHIGYSVRNGRVI